MSDPTQPLPGTNGSVDTSSFSYELPNTSPDPGFDQEVKDVISEIAGSFDDAPDDAPADEDQGDVLAPTEGQAPKAPVEEDDPKLERGVQRLVARELAAKERETAADAKIARLVELQKEVASLQGLKSAKEQAEAMAHDPVGVMKAWGHDPETIIRLALAQQLEATGQPVPEKLREFTRDIVAKREVASLRREIAEQKQAAAGQAYFNTVSNGAREYVKSVGESTPTVARVARANPDRVHREIMEEIVRDSQVRAAQDPHSDPMSYEAAAKAVEARWVELTKLFSQETAVQNGKSAAQNATKPKNATPPNTRPAAKPLAPWMKGSEKTLEDLGIEEAMREFTRVENERRRRQG